MNRAVRAAILIAAMIAGPGLAEAPLAGEGDRDAVIDQLIVSSGLDDSLADMQQAADRQLADQLGKLEGEDARFLRETFRAALDPVPLRAAIVAALRENYSETEARSALAWYQSELGKKIGEEEKRAQSPEAEQELAAFAAGFQETPPDPVRLEIAQRIDAASHSSALTTRLLMEITRGMLFGLTAVAPAGGGKEPPTPEEIDQVITQQMAQVAPMIRVQSVVILLFSGRNLSVEDNRAYLAYIESAPGQWYHRYTGTGLVHAMARAGKGVGDHVAAWTQQKQFAKQEGAQELRDAAVREGERFGKDTTQSGCTEAAFERRAGCREILCFARTRIFLESCLDTSSEDAALCAGVPGPDDLAGSIYWRVGRCEQRGTPTSACHDLMGAIEDYCASARVRL